MGEMADFLIEQMDDQCEFCGETFWECECEEDDSE